MQKLHLTIRANSIAFYHSGKLDETGGRKTRLRQLARELCMKQVAFIFAWAGIMLKFWKNLTGPCGAPTYLPTYLPYLWETKKEITVWVKVGYYTN